MSDFCLPISRGLFSCNVVLSAPSGCLQPAETGNVSRFQAVERHRKARTAAIVCARDMQFAANLLHQ
jgi:hypothetical protein